ncbi:hypothetical protein ACFU6I_11475, partial [Streptomyces sp. NPDC057486]
GQQGTPGAQGERGTPGAQGKQGERGPSGIAGLTQWQGPLVNVSAGGIHVESTAVCPAGRTAVSGGWGSGYGVVPGACLQTTTHTFGDSWTVAFGNPTADVLGAVAFAYCAA